MLPAISRPARPAVPRCSNWARAESRTGRVWAQPSAGCAACCPGGGFRVVDALSRIVRLGEGLSASGALSEPAMARTIEALRVCAGKLGQRPVAGGRYVATEACRRAANCAAFLDRVRREVG